MLLQRKLICWGVWRVLLLCLCSVVIGQEKDSSNEWAELLSKSVERATAEFIQIPGPNPILVPGKSGWDSRVIEAADILKDLDTYYLYYHAVGEGGSYQLGVATADHPLGPWKKYENNPVLKDFGYVGGVVKHTNGKYYLYTAHVIGSVGPDYSPMALAIADQPEGPYVKFEGNPILKEGPWGSWDDGGYSEGEVYYHDGVFHMFYGGTKLHPTRILSHESIGYAYSFDGINFIKHPKNPVALREMQPDGGAFSEVHAYQEGPLIYLFHTLRYNSRHGDEDLGVQVLATQRPFKVRMPILIKKAIAPGEVTSLDECRPLCLDNITTLSLTVECTYEAKTSKPMGIHIKTSFDGLKYDTVEFQFHQLDLVEGQTVRQTFDVMSNVKYMKVQLVNPNDSKEIKEVNIYATLGG